MSDAAEASEAELDGDYDDPWDSVIQKAFDKCQDKFEEEVIKMVQKKDISETEAKKRVYQEMRSAYRKAVGAVFMDRMVWCDTLRKHPVYKAIKKTATSYVDLDDYGQEEAWRCAIGHRKYLFDTILQEYYPSKLEGDQPEEDIQDNEEPSAKRTNMT